MKQETIPGTGQEKIAKVEQAAHALCDLKDERKRLGERIEGATDKLITVMRAQEITTYRQGGLEIDLDEVEKVKVKRTAEEGGGVS